MSAIVKEEYSDGIVKEIRHYKDLTKEEYFKILEQRMNQFVVWNKRIMNPIDKHDQSAHFILIWERDKLLGCTRVCDPYTHVYTHAETGVEYQYPVWDKCTIVDMRVSMFPTDSSNAVCHMWAPEWGLRIAGTQNGMLDSYADGHPILLAYAKQEKNLHFIGEHMDQWGYIGYRWVYEPENKQDSEKLFATYVEKHERT
jgi:hypothetical protein